MSEKWKLVPTELTAENGMKHALIGEFFEVVEEVRDGEPYIMKVPVSWTTIKIIHRAMIAAVHTPEMSLDDDEADGAAIATIREIRRQVADAELWEDQSRRDFTRGFITGICDRLLRAGLPPDIEPELDRRALRDQVMALAWEVANNKLHPIGMADKVDELYMCKKDHVKGS